MRRNLPRFAGMTQARTRQTCKKVGAQAEPAFDAPALLGSNTGMEDRYKIAVTADTTFVADQSNEREGRYVFAYTITIQNLGTIAAQLVSRHWIITEADNKVREVRGIGVIGNQPLLQPGDRFQYTSGAQIATPVGTMRGSYQMVAADGTSFEATIPQFTLAAPRILH